jgi:hypothetical protein
VTTRRRYTAAQAKLTPVHADLDAAASRYTQLAARVPKTRRYDTAPGVPGASVPIDAAIVDHMVTIETWLPWWNQGADWLLDPQPKVDLTRREHLHCPGCQSGTLVAWPGLGLIRCLQCRAQWEGDREWRRLGVVLGVHEDRRYGARLPDIAAP